MRSAAVPDPAVEIANVLKGATAMLEEVARQPGCLRCIELEAQVQELEAILDEIADMEDK